MTHIDDALQLSWWCELCERMHPIGEHDPGKSWPPAAAMPAPRETPQDDPGRLRCFCGLHLFATEKRCRSAKWARHVAHIRAFQQETQRVIGAARRKHADRDPMTGPCARCRKPCRRYGPDGAPLCEECQSPLSRAGETR
jgi:hypothetical protein